LETCATGCAASRLASMVGTRSKQTTSMRCFRGAALILNRLDYPKSERNASNPAPHEARGQP
jgi:hypothetical protein